MEKFLDFAVIVLSSGERNGGQDIWRIYIYIYFQRVDPDPMAIPRTFSFNKDAARDFALPSLPLARSPQIYIYIERERVLGM